MPDHEHKTVFNVSLTELNITRTGGNQGNGTSGNGTGGNGTGGNGTGDNGTGRWFPGPQGRTGREDGNGTGNGTGMNDTGTNGTGTNQTNGNPTGTNGSGTNGTGGNQTGNGTGTNQTGGNGTVPNATQNGTLVQLVMGSGANATRTNMTHINGTENYTVTLGPWRPGTEFCYTFEATLTNGTVLYSNASWVRTPQLIDILWHRSYEEARLLALELHRPLMAYILSDLSHDSRTLDETVFIHSRVVAQSEDLVCVMINSDTEPQIGTALSVKRLPCVIFINASTGMVLDRFYGVLSPDTMVKEMKYILKKGSRPNLISAPMTEFRLEATLLGAFLIAAPVVMFVYFRGKKNG